VGVGIGGIDISATVKGEGDAGYDDSFQRSWLQDMRDDKYSRDLVVEWSYSTAGSDGAGFAGKLSDVFLIPTFQILYKETKTVNFDSISCTAAISTSTKFDIKNAENKKAISFLSYRQVITETLPELETQLKNLDASQVVEKETIEASISGWNEALAEYEEVNMMAWNGDLLKRSNVEDWMDSPRCEISSDQDITRYRCRPYDLIPNLCEVCEDFKDEHYQCNGLTAEDCKNNWDLDLEWKELPDDHPYWNLFFTNPQLDTSKAKTSLLPNALTNDNLNEINKSVKNLLDRTDEKYEDFFNEVDHIHFSGGGNVMTIEFDDEKMEEHMQIYNPASKDENSDFHMSHGGSAQHKGVLGFKVLGGLKVKTEVHYIKDTTHRISSEDGTMKKSSVKVELGDADVGDEFLVGVYIDPIHGTFVFNTTAGQSKCPHENNTNPVELPSISVLKAADSIVEVDKPMVFDLEIANLGYGDSSFVLFHEVLDNPDGLLINTFKSDTRTWLLPSTYHGGKATKTTVTLSRGPKLNIYNPVRIYLQSKCGFEWENGDAIDEAVLFNKVVVNEDGALSKSIEFTEPCPEVQWSSASTLGKYKKFFINKDTAETLSVTLQNPSTIPLDKKVTLTSVGLEYRKVSEGFKDWNAGRQNNDKIINFKNNAEDSFGFITADWKYPVIDGIYEIRLKSTCQCDRCPLNLKEYTSDGIIGSIDLTPPRVFGEPSPFRNLSPGEALTISFTEDIDCEQPYKFDVGIEVSEMSSILFGNNDIDIFCVKNSIAIKLKEDRLPAKSLNYLLGRTYVLTIDGVKDKSGNSMEEMYIIQSNFECLPPTPELKISFNSDREYLTHEPIVFNVTISNNQVVSKLATEINFEITGRVMVVSNPNLCMTLEASSDNVVMATCQLDDSNQVFGYYSTEQEIKIGEMCLEYHTSSKNVYINECYGISNQRWYYNSETKEIKTQHDENCLDKAGTNNLKMYRCHGGNNQKFEIPSGWDMTQTTNPSFEMIRDASERSTTFLELGVKLRTNNDDLTIMANGEPLVSDQVYTLRGNDDISTTIAIVKGPGHRLKIPPVTLFLRSHCSTDSHNPIEVSSDLWNWESQDSGERFIKFTPTCPTIAWAGAMMNRQYPLTIGADDLLYTNFLLEVSIFNQGFMESTLFDRSIHNPEAVRAGEANIQDILLLYRRVGASETSSWKNGILHFNKTRSLFSDSQYVDFSMKNVEDEFGYATLFWDLQNVSDGSFEVKVISRCILSSTSTMVKGFSSDVIEIIVDRVPPKVYFSDVTLPSSAHPTSKEYFIQFTEDINCRRPFLFNILIRGLDNESDLTELKDDDGIHVICVDQSVKFRFDRETYDQQNLDMLLKSNIQVHLYGVQDLAGNFQSSNFSMPMSMNAQ